MIRLATERDVPAMLAIYAPYILETSITFEIEVPSEEAFLERFRQISGGYPWLVWEENGRVLGYAYGSRAFERAAYAWDADMSIYLDRSERGRKIGERLYGCLEQMLARQGYHNVYALITGENEPSRRFHERLGYELFGIQKKTGWKRGQWHDIYWYEKRLRPAENPGDEPKPFAPTQTDLEIMQNYSGIAVNER